MTVHFECYFRSHCYIYIFHLISCCCRCCMCVYIHKKLRNFMWFKSVEFWIYSERLESGFGRSAVICLSWGDSDDGVLSDRKQYEFGRCSHECRGFCQALDLMFNNEFNLMFGTWCAGLQIKVYCHFVFTIFLIFNLRILATLCGFVFLVLQVMNWHCAPWSTYIIQFTACDLSLSKSIHTGGLQCLT